MESKLGGAEPLPYEGDANYRKEIPKFLFGNSSEERANNVRPYNPHPQQSNKPKFIGVFSCLVMLPWVVKLASELKRILRILSATLQRNAIAIRTAPATE